MKIDLTSLAFGYSVLDGGATPNWATALGQSFNYKLEERSGVFPLLPGLIYCSVPLDSIKVRKGKGGVTFPASDPDSGVVLASLFRKVYLNDILVPDGKFVLYVDRDSSRSHSGRLRLKYSRYVQFTDNGVDLSNSDFIDKAERALGLSNNACWFVYDISIRNQDELILSTVVVDQTNSKQYQNAAELKSDWLSLIPATNAATGAVQAVAVPPICPDILAAIRTKPFILLAGISGTGKSRMVRQLACGCCPAGSSLVDEQKPGNFEMVQVRPNWHDSTELLGYATRITDDGKPRYVLTDFVRFLAKAWLFPDVPFFLCLDEMNLAPVEQYFAEYLSVVETRKRDAATGAIRTDVLVRFPPETAARAIGELLAPFEPPTPGFAKAEVDALRAAWEADGGLRIPPNLVVMGTVNMDETTFSFSRKVLDRAMSFELSDVKLAEGLDASPETPFGSIPAAAATPSRLKPAEFYAANRALCDAAVAFLGTVNKALERTPFQIAYRTRDEVLLYCVERTEGGASLPQALDEAACMKILSRVEGDQKREGVLKALAEAVRAALDAAGDAARECTACTEKIGEMLAQLKDGGYTSFWTR